MIQLVIVLKGSFAVRSILILINVAAAGTAHAPTYIGIARERNLSTPPRPPPPPPPPITISTLECTMRSAAQCARAGEGHKDVTIGQSEALHVRCADARNLFIRDENLTYVPLPLRGTAQQLV